MHSYHLVHAHMSLKSETFFPYKFMWDIPELFYPRLNKNTRYPVGETKYPGVHGTCVEERAGTRKDIRSLEGVCLVGDKPHSITRVSKSFDQNLLLFFNFLGWPIQSDWIDCFYYDVAVRIFIGIVYRPIPPAGTGDEGTTREAYSVWIDIKKGVQGHIGIGGVTSDVCFSKCLKFITYSLPGPGFTHKKNPTKTYLKDAG